MNYNKMYKDKNYYSIVKEILRNTEFQRRKDFLHHHDSVYDHSVKVSVTAYKIAKFLSKFINVSLENVAIAGLLHDFYITPWREYKEKRFFKKHGFVHGKIACINANEFFPKIVNKRILNSIKRHMFPLTVIPPLYIEGWIVTLADKWVSFEIIRKPLEIPRYVGIKNLHVVSTSKNILSHSKIIYSNTKKFVSRMY